MKTAVITGVSSGIGEATAQLLLEHGWKVYGLSRRHPKLEADLFTWLQMDLSDSVAFASLPDKIPEPAVDLLVSNAGVAFQELPTHVSARSYSRMFNVNVLAPMLLVACLKPKLQQAAILSISSVSDRLIEKDLALYCSSKAANTRYFEALAQELSEAKVISLLPDYVDTPMLRNGDGGEAFKWEDTIKVKDLAELVLTLTEKNLPVSSGANIIVVTNGLVEDLKNREKLYGFNTDTQELLRLG